MGTGYLVLGVGNRILGTVKWEQETGYSGNWVLGTGYWMWNLKLGTWYLVLGTGYQDQSRKLFDLILLISPLLIHVYEQNNYIYHRVQANIPGLMFGFYG